MDKLSLTIIILTFNEEIHLERALRNISGLSDDIIIIDSFSTDQTEAIAKKYNARFFQHAFTNQANQMNWGLENIEIKSDWILRLDADEYLTDELILEIKEKVPTISAEVSGVYLSRRVYFMDKWIKRGGYYPTWILRLWRTGKGRVEQKWMDEHVLLEEGESIKFENDFVDDNLNNLAWWTAKHNNYSTREAAEELNKKHQFFAADHIAAKIDSEKQAETKRWFKNNVYAKFPPFTRSLVYFFYRYFFKLGFLDGKAGLIWHVLQGFWYRFLVDAKIEQIEMIARKEKKSVKEVLVEDFGLKL